MMDLLIRGARVVDGTGNPWFRADVGVANERIAFIGDGHAVQAAHVIEADGLVLAPGFIDMHTHCDREMADPELKANLNYLHQGVTTVKAGSCGGSPWPLDEFFAKLNEQGIGTNITVMIGHNTVRQKVFGIADREPTPEELAEMKRLVAEAMEHGARGMSTGLKYTPGIYSKPDEVKALAEVVAQYRGIYDSHMRDEAEEVLESVRETIDLAASSGLPVTISHHKIVGTDQWGLSETTLAEIDAARAKGLDVTCDQYPYTASSSSLTILFPGWALVGGQPAIKERLADPATRAKVKEGIIDRIIHDRGGNNPANILIARCRFDSSFDGLNVAQITETKYGMEPTIPNAAEAIMEMQSRGGAQAIYFAICEDDLERIIKHPAVMIGSDGGIIAYGVGNPHPRNYGTFPRVLGRYVRERGVLTLEQAIRKMTSLPARTLRLRDRGLIAPGYWADLTLFDPDQVGERNSWLDPHQYPAGIHTVIVNGVVAINQGEYSGALSGQVLCGPGKK